LKVCKEEREKYTPPSCAYPVKEIHTGRFPLISIEENIIIAVSLSLLRFWVSFDAPPISPLHICTAYGIEAKKKRENVIDME
jgi:hypothetical protein